MPHTSELIFFGSQRFNDDRDVNAIGLLEKIGRSNWVLNRVNIFLFTDLSMW